MLTKPVKYSKLFCCTWHYIKLLRNYCFWKIPVQFRLEWTTPRIQHSKVKFRGLVSFSSASPSSSPLMTVSIHEANDSLKRLLMHSRDPPAVRALCFAEGNFACRWSLLLCSRWMRWLLCELPSRPAGEECRRLWYRMGDEALQLQVFQEPQGS